MKGDDISERLLDFAVRVIRLVNSLPRSVVGRHIGGQLARSGTAAGANYEEARGAESRADFIHKVGIAGKEAKASLYWLRLIQRSQLVPPELLDGFLQEANELCAILSRSVTTARKNVAAKNPPAD